MGNNGFILLQKALKQTSSCGFLLRISLMTQPKVVKQPPSPNWPRNFTNGASPGKKCKACPTVTKSYFAYGRFITSLKANYTSTPGCLAKNPSLAFVAASIMFSLISTPLLWRKWGAKAKSNCPVPVATSRYRCLFLTWARQLVTNDGGYLGLNLSQLMPWVLKPNASINKIRLGQ